MLRIELYLTGFRVAIVLLQGFFYEPLVPKMGTQAEQAIKISMGMVPVPIILLMKRFYGGIECVWGWEVGNGAIVRAEPLLIGDTPGDGITVPFKDIRQQFEGNVFRNRANADNAVAIAYRYRQLPTDDAHMPFPNLQRLIVRRCESFDGV